MPASYANKFASLQGLAEVDEMKDVKLAIGDHSIDFRADKRDEDKEKTYPAGGSAWDKKDNEEYRCERV